MINKAKQLNKALKETSISKEYFALKEALEKSEIELLFQSGAASNEIIQKSQRYEEIKNMLDEKEMRWLELSEKDI